MPNSSRTKGWDDLEGLLALHYPEMRYFKFNLDEEGYFVHCCVLPPLSPSNLYDCQSN